MEKRLSFIEDQDVRQGRRKIEEKSEMIMAEIQDINKFLDDGYLASYADTLHSVNKNMGAVPNS